MPYALPLNKETPVARMTKWEVNDRWERHTKDCRCCREAFEMFCRWRVAAWVAVGLAGSAIQVCALVYVALQGSGVNIAAAPFAAAAMISVAVLGVALWVLKRIASGRKLLMYTENANELRNAK